MSVKSESSKKGEMTDKITLSFLTKFIKTYNGDRESLPAFLTNCDNAMSLASSDQQPVLCKFIISQLEGKAQVACSLKTFTKWTELKNFLRSTFGEKKHSIHLLSDLQHCKQLLNEDVTKFSLRIEQILTRIHSNIHYSCKDERELLGRTAAMEDLALNTFLLGLNPSLSNIVRCKNPTTLSDAIQYAIDEEKIFNLYKINTKSQKQCSVCNKAGHTSSECFKNKKPFSKNVFQIHHQNNFNKNQKPNSNNSYIKTCNYCKRTGHTITECRKRQFNENRRENANSAQNDNSYIRSRVAPAQPCEQENLN